LGFIFYGVVEKEMKNLRRYWRLTVGFGLHRRCFSVLANARSQSSNPEPEDLVYVGTSTTATTRHVSSLHGLVQLCARTRANMEGKACHAQVIRVGLQADTLTSNMLINMYSKCGLVGCARKVFDEMLERSLVSWNTMIGSWSFC
jgi:pentatricopeptide repeat protein